MIHSVIDLRTGLSHSQFSPRVLLQKAKRDYYDVAADMCMFRYFPYSNRGNTVRRRLNRFSFKAGCRSL
jgi:hypothetical protein